MGGRAGLGVQPTWGTATAQLRDPIQEEEPRRMFRAQLEPPPTTQRTRAQAPLLLLAPGHTQFAWAPASVSQTGLLAWSMLSCSQEFEYTPHHHLLTSLF